MGCLHGKAFAAQKLAEQAGKLDVVIDQQDVHRSNLPRARRLGYGTGLVLWVSQSWLQPAISRLFPQG
jgi:hypothetical protein